MMKSDEVVSLYKNYVIPTYSQSVVLVRGEGVRAWDAEGREYLDFMAGIAVLNCGHCHPNIVQAITEQARLLVHSSNIFYNEYQGRLAQALAERSLGGKCFFCNSGGEANEALIKLGRLWGHPKGKYQFITMRNSFHGRTLATVTATGQEKFQKGFEPLPAGFVYADFNDIASCRKAINDKTVAILVEAVQGEGGVLPAEPEFIKGLRALCDEKDILLFFDEVQCGMGRTGRWFGYQHYDIVPDGISMAKALGNGIPIGAISVAPKLADVFGPGTHASTFGGTPLACAAALATIKTIEEEGLVDNAANMGRYFSDQLEQMIKKYPRIKGARGKGLMRALIVDGSAKEFVKHLREAGLLALTAGDDVVRFLPPLIVKKSHIDAAVACIEKAYANWSATTAK